MTRDEIEAALAPIRQHIRADGGDIELLHVHGGDATVRLSGVCASCPMSSMTLYLGVEAALRERVEGFEALHVAGGDPPAAPAPPAPSPGPRRSAR